MEEKILLRNWQYSKQRHLENEVKGPRAKAFREHGGELAECQNFGTHSFSRFQNGQAPLRRSPILISYQTDRLLKITQIIELPSKTGLIKRNPITHKGQEKSIITLVGMQKEVRKI